MTWDAWFQVALRNTENWNWKSQVIRHGYIYLIQILSQFGLFTEYVYLLFKYIFAHIFCVVTTTDVDENNLR